LNTLQHGKSLSDDRAKDTEKRERNETKFSANTRFIVFQLDSNWILIGSQLNLNRLCGAVLYVKKKKKKAARVPFSLSLPPLSLCPPSPPLALPLFSTYTHFSSPHPPFPLFIIPVENTDKAARADRQRGRHLPARGGPAVAWKTGRLL
jgi:hypothetical protein